MQIENCDFPDNLLYDLENNVWIRLDTAVVRVGITSVHAALAGKLNKIDFKPEGTELRKGQSVATVESTRYFGVVRTPVSGRLVAVNSKLLGEPKLANDSPYTEGWFVEIEGNPNGTEVTGLVGSKGSEDRIRAQIRELRVRCFAAYPDYEMWEIGVECAAVLVRLNELLEHCNLNAVVHVVSDDPTADIEMERWADQTGQKLLETRNERNFMHFIVKKVR